MADFALYLHVPFCRRKCAYCDFASWAGREEAIEPYLRALRGEIRAQGERWAAGRTVTSVFFGGGTPSLLSGGQVQALLDELRAAFAFSPDAEITLEGNPGTLTRENLRAYRQAGVNRLSLGVQSFSDALLARVGRIHTAKQAEEAVSLARETGFDNLNLDLMYGLPGQTEEDFSQSVRRAAQLGVEHLSLYSLILEEGTPLFRAVQAGECALPDDETTLAMQHAAEAFLSQAGYTRYEISNYAKEGRECRHNLLYWSRGEYLGLGCAAHSLMEETRFSNPERLDEYLAGARAASIERLTPSDRYEEQVMLGLRTREGVPESLFTGREPVVARLIDGGFLARENGRVHATQTGADLLNALILELT